MEAPAVSGTNHLHSRKLLRLGLIILVGIAALLWAQNTWAQAATMNFPIIDNIMCGFLAYLRSKFAPIVGVTVVVLSMVGHWLGTGKVWGTLMYVGLGLGLILGIGSMVASYTGVGTSCIN